MANFNLTFIEVHGQDILSFVDALGTYASIGDKLLQELKIGTRDARGRYRLIPETW